MSKNAFTLVETLVAIAIVTIAVAGPLVTATRALVLAYTARDQVTASYLAQEGVEYVRLMRDSVYLADYQANPQDPTLSSDAFNDFLTGSQAGSATQCIGAGDGTAKCALADPLLTMGIGANRALAVCGRSCPPLYINNGRYTTSSPSGSTLTPYTRSISFYGGSSGTLGSELEVIVTVSWSERGVPYSTSATDYLSPWQ
jgi:prepilin-type N-terminal cleavage/methylation domain-containing protein